MTEIFVSSLFNRAQKKLSSVSAWENSKKANLEAKLKKIEVAILFHAPGLEFNK